MKYPTCLQSSIMVHLRLSNNSKNLYMILLCKDSEKITVESEFGRVLT